MLIEIITVLTLCIIVYIIVKFGVNKFINGIGVIYGIGNTNSAIKTGGSNANSAADNANNKSEQVKIMKQLFMNLIVRPITKVGSSVMPIFCMIVGVLLLLGDDVKKVPVLKSFVGMPAKILGIVLGTLIIFYSAHNVPETAERNTLYVGRFVLLSILFGLFALLYFLIEKFMSLIYNSYDGMRINDFNKLSAFFLLSLTLLNSFNKNLITIAKLRNTNKQQRQNNPSQTNTNS